MKPEMSKRMLRVAGSGLARLAVATAVAIPTVVALADAADARIVVNHNECVGRDT